MNGLDTNVLLRFLVEDDPAQCDQASRIVEKAFEAGEQLFLSDVVMCESVWVLGSAYRFSKEQIVLALGAVLDSDTFAFEDHGRLRRAFLEFQSGSADFADYLIGVVGRVCGCESTLTFDRSLATSRSFTLID